MRLQVSPVREDTRRVLIPAFDAFVPRRLSDEYHQAAPRNTRATAAGAHSRAFPGSSLGITRSSQAFRLKSARRRRLRVRYSEVRS